MSALAFDTHAYVKKLEAAGFTEHQAEVLAETQAELINDQLASKLDIENVRSDIENVRNELKRDLKELELRLEAKQAEIKAEIIRWTIGAGIFQTALIAALLLKLVH
jgi:hypothetical protein